MMPHLSLATLVAAQQSPSAPAISGPQNINWIIALGLIGLLPFVLTMVTSFAKIAVVGGLLRKALGLENIPPNTVITGLALVLTIHIMAPTIGQVWSNLRPEFTSAKDGGTGRLKDAEHRLTVDDMHAIAEQVRAPIDAFLLRHASPANVDLFRSLEARLAASRPTAATGAAESDDARFRKDPLFVTLTINTPAFVVTELTEAFLIGFLILIPFLVIDLVVSNVILVMGLQQSLQTQTVALPLKLLLFVLVDGWNLILKGLVLGYA